MKEDQVQDSNEIKDQAINENQAADEAEAAQETGSFTGKRPAGRLRAAVKLLSACRIWLRSIKGARCVCKPILTTSAAVRRRRRKSWRNTPLPSWSVNCFLYWIISSVHSPRLRQVQNPRPSAKV